MDFSPELMRGTVAPIVLGLLEGGPQYGYEMVKVVNARSGGLLEWREGTLYPALHRLESDGLIKGKWENNPESGKPRKYYHLTRRGQVELSKRRGEWKAFAGAVNALLFSGA